MDRVHFLVILSLVSVIFAFQNCGSFQTPGNLSNSSSSSDSLDDSAPDNDLGIEVTPDNDTNGMSAPLVLQSVFVLTTDKLASGFNTDESEAFKDMTVDDAGNVLMVGETLSPLDDLTPAQIQADQLINVGNRYDGFVIKVSPSGQIQWITQFTDNTIPAPGTSNYRTSCNAVLTDSNSDVFCIGKSSGNLTGLLETDGSYSVAIQGSFVAKIDGANGTILWINQLSGAAAENFGLPQSNSSECVRAKFDPAGDIVCVGYTSNGSEFFAAKYSAANGDAIWARVYDENDTNLILAGGHDGRFQSLDIDSTGGIYATGFLANDSMGGFQERDVIIAKINNGGSLEWMRQWTPAQEPFFTNTNQEQSGHAIQVKSNGDIVVSGRTAVPLVTDNDFAPSTNFLATLDPSGDVRWLKHLGDAESAASCEDILLDNNENILCVGSVQGSYTDTNGTATVVTTGTADMFTSMYDPMGNPIIEVQFGASIPNEVFNTEGYDNGYFIKTSPSGRYYMGAYTRTFPAENEILFIGFDINR